MSPVPGDMGAGSPGRLCGQSGPGSCVSRLLRFEERLVRWVAGRTADSFGSAHAEDWDSEGSSLALGGVDRNTGWTKG